MDVNNTATKNKPRMLLHVCCAPCSSSVVERLEQQYDLTLFYYNPNIHPESEYKTRCDELVRWCADNSIALIIADYEPKVWHHLVQGYEAEPERGERCTRCYRMRLDVTARRAVVDGFALFTTVLSISPHKDALRINTIGGELEQELAVPFYPANFKKQGGFQRSLEISRQQGFYRQNYCGCCYSLAESEQRRKDKLTSSV